MTEYTNISANTERLFKSPNPYQTFSDLVYTGIFSNYPMGIVMILSRYQIRIKNANTDNITNIWCLSPDVTRPVLRKEIPNPFGG